MVWQNIWKKSAVVKWLGYKFFKKSVITRNQLLYFLQFSWKTNFRKIKLKNFPIENFRLWLPIKFWLNTTSLCPSRPKIWTSSKSLYAMSKRLKYSSIKLLSCQSQNFPTSKSILIPFWDIFKLNLLTQIDSEWSNTIRGFVFDPLWVALNFIKQIEFQKFQNVWDEYRFEYDILAFTFKNCLKTVRKPNLWSHHNLC